MNHCFTYLLIVRLLFENISSYLAMHEISLVRNIFNALEEEFPGRVESIRSIYLTVGLLSNVQPILMQNAFAAVLEDEPRYRKSSLEVEVLPVHIYCKDCDQNTEVLQYRFVCSRCGNASRHIVQGEELLITKVAFEETGELLKN